MRVLIVCEGKHEQRGALEAIVRRLNADLSSCDHDRISRRDLHAHHGAGQGLYKRAVRWMLEAQKRGYEAVVLLTDEDGHPERRVETEKAQAESELSLIRRAIGVAIRTFDAWILADEQALSLVLGRNIQRQPAPESINHPKATCAQLFASCRCESAPSQVYSEVLQCADLGLLEDRCPSGFRPFAARVRALSPAPPTRYS